ncbi:uncharacterized protein Dwil_GK16297 [Drosophila willistoni]|uniref:Transcription factor grauzone n=1 Tax=Drosophila willistoni TaxID=7260 RepID=B4N1G9_DROWI|nr:transcription factor grauzone [Drosophila willistoni]EDW78208.2 uncharacterized protein Dwil_GK16297 [Drosophila willistoni]
MNEMICRLCLEEGQDGLSIYELAKFIEEHLNLKMEENDEDLVNQMLCQRCWQQIKDFQEFCLMVDERQRNFAIKVEHDEEQMGPEPAVVVWNMEDEVEQEDFKYMLCEPENDALNDDPAAATVATTTPEEQPDESLDVKPKRRKRRNEEAKEPSLPQRQTRQRGREAAAAAKKQATPPNAASASKGRLVKRLTIKEIGKKCQKNRVVVAKKVVTPPNSESADPASISEDRLAKRLNIKEMDEFIAANVNLDCCLCGASLTDFIDLKRHFRSAHQCTGYVKCCNNRYKKRTLYVDHLHYHKDPQYFSCQPCQKSFLNRNSHDMHMLRFHSKQQELVHQCGICEAKFAKKYLLTMHLKGHKGLERPEECETCGKSFRTKFELAAHVKRMHDSDFTPVICDICGTHFRCKANFLIHKKSLHPEGPVDEVQCKLCGRWLRDERSMRKHLARHDDRDGDTKYRCSLCQVEKSSRVALSSHMRYHHSEKKHKCNLCGKEFKLPRALAEHMATHTGIDLYSCAFCPRTFKSHANMHNHKKKMHPNEWVRKYSQPSNKSSLNANLDLAATDGVEIPTSDTMQETVLYDTCPPPITPAN